MDQREPLSELNKSSVAKPKSRLPTPGKSTRLRKPSASQSSHVAPIPQYKGAEAAAPPGGGKRKADVDNAPAMKKARLNTSSASDPGVSSAPSRPSSRNSKPSQPVRNKKPLSSANRTMGKTAGRPPSHPRTTTRATAATTRSGPGQSAAVPPATKGKKRAGWDVKGRLQDQEAQNSDLLARMAQVTKDVNQLKSVSSNLKVTVSEKSQTVTQLEADLAESRRDLEETRRTLSRQVDDLTFSNSTLERQRTTLDSELKASMQEASGLKMSVATLTSSQAGMTAELTSTKSHLEKMLSENQELKQLVEKYEQMITEMGDKLQNHETERRKLHNMIQELKGNIRVFCRIRPLLGDETLGNNGEINHIHFPDESTDKKMLQLERLADINPNESLAATRKGSNNLLEFTFDKVFSPKCQQCEVFEEISQLVQSALDGYHVCIFAYGQTGSGKTYTMEGPCNSNPDTEGMIPRAVNQVFSTVYGLQDKGWKYSFEVSFLEIYNETIRDLLGNGRDDVKHEIRMKSADCKEVIVTNLTTVKVTQPEKVTSLLNKAGENRAVAETKCNARSSRSHSVFQMRIVGKNDITEETCNGLLNLIDLAGSERLKDSGSEGQRLKETQAINSSLSHLGNVIMALGNKESHIPYRNSKLTHLLHNSLGGNSKVLMFANVSPKEECFGETLNSLRFATKVNNCNVGTAHKRK